MNSTLLHCLFEFRFNIYHLLLIFMQFSFRMKEKSVIFEEY